MDFSIIIPHRNSVRYLPKLFSSIPNSDRIEIIIVDNSFEPVTKDDIGVNRDYILLHSAPERGAGGARNVGIEHANGKWLLFLDADDYFAEGAFDVFFSKVNTDSDIVYTCMGGVYLDTGKPSDRGSGYTRMVQQYLAGNIPETDLRFCFSSPCCKMVRHDMVKKYKLRYDEVTASNDMYFSMLSGYYAKKIEAVNFKTYIATVSKGTLTKRRDYPVISARYYVNLRYNKFLKDHGYSQYQRSILNYGLTLCKMGLRPAFEAFKLLFIYRQNPFVGYRNWISSYIAKCNKDLRDRKYITK